MTFNTVQEAFNHYRNSSLEDIETRAGEIKAQLRMTLMQMLQN